jgi:TPR repeat protein
VRKKIIVMRIIKSKITSIILLQLGVALATTGFVGSALAFDPKAKSADVSEEQGPLDLFKFGFKAYKNGEKKEAIKAYKYAAEKGHRGARWAMANMYAFGDGVREDDYEAFKNFQKITRQGVEPGSEDVGYFVNALMSLADYYQRGISNSPVKVNYKAARQLYFQAASAFGLPEAQYRLGQMILDGKGGGDNMRQAKKWLNRARAGGHASASAVYGNILFEEGQTVRGLALITSAYERAAPNDKVWILQLQEQAFALAEEVDRRAAVVVADNMLKNGMN